MKPGFQIEFDKTLFNEFKPNTFNDIEEGLFSPKKDNLDLFIENNRLKSINKSQSKEISELNDKIKEVTSEINILESINKSQSNEISELNDKIKDVTSEISRINLINKRLESEKNQLSKLLESEKNKLSKLDEPRNFKVYIHMMTGLWVYIGQTGQELEERWQNGEGYKQHNQMLYHQIKKYGWENINHILYKENLTKWEADTIEQDLIHFYAKNETATGLMVLNLAHNFL